MREGMAFRKEGAIALAAYFITVSIGSSVWWFQLISANDSTITLPNAILAGLTAATSTSGLFYIRKLYKDLFAADPQNATSISPFATLATFLYFVARPFFSAAIAVLFVLLMYGFVHAVTTVDSHLSFGFLVFSSTASAVIAVGTGKGVTRLERFAKENEGPFQYHV